MQLSCGLLLGEAGLINLLFSIEHVEQRARAQIEILLLIKLTRAGAQGFLPRLDLQGAHQAQDLAAGFQQFLPNVEAGTLYGGLRRFDRVSGSVAPGGKTSPLV